MVRKTKNNAKASRAQAERIERNNKARLKARQKAERESQKAQQKKQNEALRARQKKEREAEKARVKQYRHAGAVLKKKKVAGFTDKDWRTALPTALFRKTGKTKSKAEKTIARLHDVVTGVGKLVRVRDKKKRDELKAQGVVVQGDKAVVQKDQYIPKKGPATVAREKLGRFSDRINPDNLDEEIRAYFDRFPGRHVAIQLGDDAFPLHQTFDDPDTLIDFLETNFSSLLAKEIISAIILVPADQLNSIRERMRLRRRAIHKLRGTRPGRKPLDEAGRARAKLRKAESARRARLRKGGK